MRSAGLVLDGENTSPSTADVPIEAGDDGLVVVDDPVDDRKESRAGTAAKQIGPLLRSQADVVERGLPVPDGDDEVMHDEELGPRRTRPPLRLEVAARS
jgi:hypothetical protein